MNTIGQISEINFKIGEIFISEWTLSLRAGTVEDNLKWTISRSDSSWILRVLFATLFLTKIAKPCMWPPDFINGLYPVKVGIFLPLSSETMAISTFSFLRISSILFRLLAKPRAFIDTILRFSSCIFSMSVSFFSLTLLLLAFLSLFVSLFLVTLLLLAFLSLFVSFFLLTPLLLAFLSFFISFFFYFRFQLTP